MASSRLLPALKPLHGSGGGSVFLGALLLLLSSVDVAGRSAGSGDDRFQLEFKMPGVKTRERDEYWCMNVQLPKEPLNLVAIDPIARQEVVHHMLIYGCAAPAVNKKLYRCGMQTLGTCKAGMSSPLYGWGKNAPGIQFPEGVGTQVGPGTAYSMLILEMHYLEPQLQGDSESGIRLTLDRRGQPLTAGLASIAAGFVIPPRKPAWKVNLGCCIDSFLPVHAFAMRVHTHGLGEMVSIGEHQQNHQQQQHRGGGSGGAASAAAVGARGAFFAKRDPREPQGFYELPHGEATLHRGTRLGGGCVFNSTSRDTVTKAGAGVTDEMCNVYLMLYGETGYRTICDPKEGARAAGSPGELPPSKAASGVSPSELIRSGDWGVKMRGATGAPIGQVSGVQAVEGGRIWVFHRGDRVWGPRTFDPTTDEVTDADPIPEDCVLEVDAATGAVVRSWGSGAFYMPHGLTVDHEGNLWLTDAGLHQVFKFSPGGDKLLELGARLSPGSGPDRFCKPTHVAVALSGDFYVADGYCNSRVLHFSASGEVLGVIEPGAGGADDDDYEDYDASEELQQAHHPRKKLRRKKNGPFRIPHSLLLDECKGLLLVADRLNGLIRVFSTSGKYAERPQLAARVGGGMLPYALAPGPYGSVAALVWEAPGRTRVLQLQWDEAYAASGSHGTRLESLEVVSDWEISSPGGPAVRDHDAPHDLALVPGPPPGPDTGVREREIQLLVAETRNPEEEGGGGGLFLFRWQKQQGGERHQDDEAEDAAAKTRPRDARGKKQQQQGRGAQGDDAVLRGPTDEDGDPEIVVEDKVDLGEAIQELYTYGLPIAAVFAAVAFFLWRGLGDLQAEMMRDQAAADA